MELATRELNLPAVRQTDGWLSEEPEGTRTTKQNHKPIPNNRDGFVDAIII
ncbi:MAG TPA: hypothetical protein PKL09_03065 [bacterium]|nr:hypothetical protein [bacterium]HNS33986.1 hypothetical protein [bacterium]